MKGVQCYPCDDFFKLSKHVVTEKTQLKSLVFSSYSHSLSVASLIHVTKVTEFYAFFQLLKNTIPWTVLPTFQTTGPRKQAQDLYEVRVDRA